MSQNIQKEFIFLSTYVYLAGRAFDGNFNIPTGWFHLVLNFIGSNDGQEMVVYLDGEEVARVARKSTPGTAPQGDGRVVIGRLETDDDGYYGSIMIDELTLWNQALSLQDIQNLFQALHV